MTTPPVPNGARPDVPPTTPEYHYESRILATLEPGDLQRLLERHPKLVSLYQVTYTLAALHDSEAVLTEVVRAVFDLVQAERVEVLLRDERTGQLVSRASRARGPEGAPTVPAPSAAVIARVMDGGASVLCLDVEGEARRKDGPRVQAQAGWSAMCVPLRSRDHAIGLLQASTRTAQRTFTELDLALLTALAGPAAMAFENAAVHQALETENQTLRQSVGTRHQIVGNSRQMVHLLDLVKRVVPTDATILLRGESGTGKELIARAIHEHSARKGRPFVCVNCATLSETLLESELFGHEKGAFTGAADRKIGKFEFASGGTVFLDEVGEIPTTTQVKLLRVLEESEFERVGGNATIRVDVRILAATNEDLEAAIRAGRFREDLYYRLKVIQIEIPALRERPSDIPALAEYFLEEYSREVGCRMPQVAPETMRYLERYSWPGNVREVRNAMERAVVLGVGPTLLPEHLTPEILHGGPVAIVATASAPATGAAPASGLALADAEKEHILRVLMHTMWNKSKASHLLGISRPRLDRKIKRYDLRKQTSATTQEAASAGV